MIAGGGSPTPPVGPVRVEYIQTTDSQYFDTGVKAENDLDFELDVEVLSSGGGCCLFGARNQDVNSQPFASNNSQNVYCNNNGYLALNDKDFDSGYISNKPRILNARHTVKVINRELFVDGTSYKSSTSTQTYSYDVTVGLLRCHGTGDTWQSGTNRNVSAKIYGLKIYKSGTLIRDFLSYKDENDEGYLYDSLSGTSLYNIGTGTVTPGPSI